MAGRGGIWGKPVKKQDKYKDKALRLMGVKPVNVLQSFLNSSGAINAHEYSVYWSQMRKQAHIYLRVLLENMMTFVEENKKTVYPIESLCNTIAFIALTYPITSDISLKNTLKKWEITSGGKNFGSSKDDNIQKMVDVVRLLKRRLAELEAGRAPGGQQSLINSLVVLSSTMLSAEELKMVKDPVRYATVHGFKPTANGGHCFAYNYLRTYSNEAYAKRKEVLEISLDQLLTLRQQRQINYQLCQANLLALLHMVKQFVSMYRVDADFIERAQQVIKQFYLWPLPYGDLALMSLIVLKKELKAPGSELLRRFAQESTVPEVTGYKTSSANNELRDALYKRARPVYYFIHAMNTHAAELASIMQLDFYEEKSQSTPNAEQVTAGLPVEVTCLLLLNAINYDVSVEDADFTNVRWLAEEDVYAFFDETVVILQKALENGATTHEAREIRIREFRALKQKIHEKAVANSANPPPGYTPVDLRNLDKNVPSDWMPPLPPVAHIVMPTRLYYHKSQFRPAGPTELVPVPRTHSFECIEKLVAEFKYLADTESAVRIRVVIGGGDQNLHTVVCAWTSFQKEYVDYLNGIEVQFFLVPFEENHLSSFIARHDCWYKRHIYTPFRAHQFLLPSCDDGRRYFDNPNLKPEEQELLPHGIFLREAVEDYIREASQTVNINLFKVDVWRHPGDVADKRQKGRGSKSARLLGQQSHLPDKCIPFCQRVDIGYFAEVRKYKEKQQSEPTLSKKKFDYQPTDVNVSVYPVDASGAETPNFHDLNCAYQQISLSNVPFDKDLCFPANPLNEYLEMFADVSDARRPSKQNILVREPTQHVKKVSIRASSPDHQFSVLIDGSMFGPYYRIDVSPFMHNDGSRQLTLPVRTFFPITEQ